MIYGALMPLLASVVCLSSRVSGASSASGGRRRAEFATVASTALVALWSLHLVGRTVGGGTVEALGGLVHVDALSSYMLSIISFLSFFVAVYSVEYMRGELQAGSLSGGAVRFYYLLFNLFVFAMLLVPISDNLAFLWIAIEATTLASALLVGLSRRQSSIEAAWKYIILCTVGITFALLGTFVLYYASASAGGGAGTLSWTALNGMAGGMNPATVRLAFILVMVGYGTKAGLAPVHNWLPDAHSEAPTPISALLSGILLNCAFYGVMRFASVVDGCCGHGYVRGMMSFFGIASLVIAAIFILMQSNVKRLLAYSSVEHMGIISLAFGVGGFYGVYASLLHILNHALGKPLMFFVAGRIHAARRSFDADRVRGLLKSSPLDAALGFAGVLALAGMPPFNIFLSEFIMVRTLAAEGLWATLAVFLAASGFVFYGFLKSFGGMFLGAPEDAAGIPEAAAVRLKPVSAVMLLMAAGMLFLGLSVPAPLHELITSCAQVLGSGPGL
jgi:hydrogenase-4 component F